MKRKTIFLATFLVAALAMGSTAQAHDYGYPAGLLSGVILGLAIDGDDHYYYRDHYRHRHYPHRAYRRHDSHGYYYRDRYKRRHHGHHGHHGHHKHGHHKRDRDRRRHRD